MVAQTFYYGEHIIHDCHLHYQQACLHTYAPQDSCPVWLKWRNGFALHKLMILLPRFDISTI